MMKRLIAAAALLLTSAVAFNAAAAEQITREQAKEMKLQLLGTVDTSSTTSPSSFRTGVMEKSTTASRPSFG